MKASLFAALLSVLLIACVHQPQPTKPTANRWPFAVEGPLAEADIREIVAVVQRIPKLDHRIVRIEAKTPRSVQVDTGELRGPLDGGGHVVTLEKKNGKWTVIGDWRESVWMS